jgi:hypothetical protein
MNDQELFEAMAEEATENETKLPFDLTPEFELIAQQVDPAEMNELDLHIVSPQANPGKPDSECDLGSCESEATHHVELLSGKLFFGCSTHVDELVKLRVAKKKRKFE